ncbi:MAG: hypothetical protein NTW21_05700 [Verrucomicrobia bacterium]|nr:hypothetical protein [Verrucomicrobiota bacterium]
MKKTLSSAVLLCVCSLASAEMPGVKLLVAPNGNDANPGTLAKPFATMQRAQQEARKQRSADRGQKSEVGGQKSVKVFLREGTCYLPETLVLTAEDSGSKAAPVVYQAYEKEQAVVSGGILLHHFKWEPYKGGIMLAKMPAGFTTDQLFVNGERQPMDQVGVQKPELKAIARTPPMPNIGNDSRQANTSSNTPRAKETMVLENSSGLKWELQMTTNGWALGTASLHGKPVEQAATKGLMALRNLKNGEVRWLAASGGEKVDGRTARLSGQQEMNGVQFSWTVDVQLHDDLAAAKLVPKWSVDKDLNDREVCLAYHDGFTNDWRVQSYPWAGNSEAVSMTPIWVKGPTQCVHSEQQHFNQYSVYCYGNRKIQCLDRLFKKTGNPLFEQLKNRVMQLNFYVQVADGPYKGAITETIADPWLERKQGFEWRGSPYTSELVTDLMLQLIDMRLISKPSVLKKGH